MGEVNSTLNAIIQINPDALKIAAALDEERRNNGVCQGQGDGYDLGPLHGIPILIKDNIATADSMSNTAGSYALVGSKVPRDSHMVSKLRKAGAVLLGKTNLSQWANFRCGSCAMNGWTAVGGQTYGAYYEKHDPSGSSSGSAVASSVGLAWACLGTETSGSIVSPAQAANIVGIKPSVGLTSRDLVIPISEAQDTVGPMARTVKDAAGLLQIIAGRDCHDNYTLAVPFVKIPNYVAACTGKGLHGVRIGVADELVPDADTPSGRVVRQAITTLASLGATIVKDVKMPGFDEPTDDTTLLEVDFASDVEKYLSQLSHNPNNIHSLQDLIRFTQKDPREDWPNRDTELWESAIKLGYNNTDIRQWKLRQAHKKAAGDDGIDYALAKYNLHALVGDTDSVASWAALVGYPVVTVPAGSTLATGGNLPIGLGLTSKKWSEETLIHIAYVFEQATLMRQKLQPVYKPVTDLKDVIKNHEF
ncbi:hypothetical protein Golomagni_06976 [Golovinomyces magnicellulatus]|nr:hypothetical protein Golomagni_06976 [Golovinomyces magnicellulatus]